MEVPR
ncbi:glutamate synthase [NADPH] small chain, partial [Vibrio parahaemolyticus V-223/04]